MRTIVLLAFLTFETGYGYAPFTDAIQVPTSSYVVAMPDQGMDTFGCSNGGHFKTDTFLSECEGGYKWTCSDKQRVLLTSEDGSVKVCMKIKF